MDQWHDLAFVDEHSLRIGASTDAVWRALIAQLSGIDGAIATGYARLVRAVPSRSAGELPHQGSALPGFEVKAVEPERLLVLAGRHHFSDYALSFGLVPQGGHTLLSARTDANFPGLPGRLYRVAVIGSGGHRILTRQILRSVARRSG